MPESPPPYRIELELPSRLDFLGVVDKLADGVTELLEFDDVDKDAVAISVIEACTNAIQHGHRGDAAQRVRVSFELSEDTVVITVRDGGPGFDPDAGSHVSPPELLATRGRGIYIMRAMMDAVEFDFSAGTTVRMTKRRSQGGGSSEEAMERA